MIAGHGVGLSLSVLEACGIILPHLHPRAAKIMYSIDGENILVGFIQENGAPTVFNTLKKGQAAFVPRGAIMFFQNLGCKPVTQVYSLLFFLSFSFFYILFFIFIIYRLYSNYTRRFSHTTTRTLDCYLLHPTFGECQMM